MRKAALSDIKDIMTIINLTVTEMHAYLNYQWDDSYPQEKDLGRAKTQALRGCVLALFWFGRSFCRSPILHAGILNNPQCNVCNILISHELFSNSRFNGACFSQG